MDLNTDEGYSISEVSKFNYNSIQKAEKEFEIYRAKEMKQLESDFDKAVKMIAQNNSEK